MAAVLVEVADAIVTELNSAPLTNFGVDFTAERTYPDFEMQLEGESTLRVDVVPGDYESSEMVGRGAPGSDSIIEHVVWCDVGIRQRGLVMADNQRRDPDRVDDLIFVTQKISDYFVQLALGDYAAATWVPTSGEKPIRAAYVREHLHKWGQFTSIVRLTYEVVA